MALVEVEKLRRSYVAPDGELTTVVNIDQFALPARAQVALQGGSGSGKTTFLHLLAGILLPDEGRIRIDGREIVTLSEAARDRLRAKSIGYVFQTFNLLHGYTALENVLLAMSFGRGANERDARRLLERVGLADRIDYYPRQLSVGQQQRVAVARALANEPQLVLADEPTGNLDRRHAEAALNLIREVCAERGAALLLVSHDETVLARFESVFKMSDLNRAAAVGLSAPLSVPGGHR